MANQNIEINYYTGSSYNLLYPKTINDNVINSFKTEKITYIGNGTVQSYANLAFDISINIPTSLNNIIFFMIDGIFVGQLSSQSYYYYGDFIFYLKNVNGIYCGGTYFKISNWGANSEFVGGYVLESVFKNTISTDVTALNKLLVDIYNYNGKAYTIYCFYF